MKMPTRRASAPSGRLERWVGAMRLESLSGNFNGWYGPPVALLDVPGVKVCGDGDFIGNFDRGFFACAGDAMREGQRRLRRAWNVRPAYGQLNSGYASMSDAISEISGGKTQLLGPLLKAEPAAPTIGTAISLWLISGGQPSAGNSGAATPGGTVHVSSDAGAIPFANAAGGDTSMLLSADFYANAANMSLLIYDRTFSVAKTASSLATEAVSGVPTRYTSIVPGAADYAGGSFAFPEAAAQVSAVAHNWTVCKYTNSLGTTGQSFPSVAGRNTALINSIDLPLSSWFMPLAAGDVGLTAISQLQCNVNTVATAVNFVIGHPICVMAFPVSSFMLPYDFVVSRQQLPRIFDNACLAMMHLPAGVNTQTTFSGMLWVGQG